MKKLLSLFFFTAFLCTTITNAQTVEEIVKNYYESIGGVEAWKELKSMKMSGTSSMQGMEFPLALYSKRPNFEKIEIEVQGMQIVQAFDGKTAWGINPFQGDTGPTKADEDTNEEAAKKKFEDELIDYGQKGHTLELLGDEEIEGAATHKVKLTKKDGDEVIYFFDAENYVPIMIRSFAGAGPMKGQAVETYLSDYEEVEGIMMPMTMVQKMNGTTFLQGTMEEVALNVEIADDVFRFPEVEEKMKEPTKEAVEKEVGAQMEDVQSDKIEVEKEVKEMSEKMDEKGKGKIKEKKKKKDKKDKKDKKQTKS